MRALRWGVVGFGLAGRIFHAAVIDAVDGLELAAIVQRRGDDARTAYPRLSVFRTLEEMLASANVDGVTIATPNDTHAALARQCLEAGKHVVVDKPLTVTSTDAGDLIALARARRRILTVYQNRRWDGDFLTIQQLLRSQVLGELRSYESHFDRFRPVVKAGAWRESAVAGSGVLLDLGSHLVDQALVLFGEPAAVYADVRRERPGAKADDAFDLRLFYPEHAVWLRASCLAALPAIRFIVHGTKASYRKFGLDPQEDRLRAGDLFQSKPWGQEPEIAWGTLTRATDAGAETSSVPTLPGDYRNFYSNVRDAIFGIAELAVPPVGAWRTLRILEWAQQSSEQRTVVPCDWSTEP